MSCWNLPVRKGETDRRPVIESRLVHCDETPFVVVQNGKSSGAKNYMWVYHTGPEHGSSPFSLYQYSPTRKTENPRNFLKGYQVILVTDGYQVYHTLEKESGGDLKVAGCWAHANGLRPYYYFKYVLGTILDFSFLFMMRKKEKERKEHRKCYRLKIRTSSLSRNMFRIFAKK